MGYRWVMLLSAVLLVGCASTMDVEQDRSVAESTPHIPVLPNIAVFSPTAAAPSTEQLLSLTPEQEQEFLSWYHADRRADRPGHERLRNYLEEHLVGFEYVGETLLPSEALARHEGNCMSLAALTQALSDLAGIEHRFQIVNTPPLFDRNREVILSSDHVRSRIYDPSYESEGDGFVLQRPHIIIDYFSERRGLVGRGVSKNAFLAMFYRNLAVEALMAERIDRAYTLAQAALEQDPGRPDVLNLIAVLHRRAGDAGTAEALFRHVLDTHGRRADVLNNYSNLLRAQGREVEAQTLEWQLTRLDDANPFHWVALGERARENGSLELALKWYEAAIERAPYLHEAYWRAAIVLRELGHPEQSTTYLQMAAERSNRGEARARYQQKLQALNGRHFIPETSGP
jgi:Tfp pilus assembly protein PilF